MRTSRAAIVMIGNLLYHFDRALFNLLIPFLAPIFFPQVDPIYALIYLFAINPLTILAKPLGALLFGHLGDRFGMEKVLSITLFGMAIKTALMGFLPTYDQVGLAAPLLLALTRLLIGFFSAGETTGGAILLFESSPPKLRNLMSALFDAAGILGVLVASASIWAFHSFPEFWRILFWSGSLVGTIGWAIRRTSMGTAPKLKASLPPMRVIWQYRKAVIGIAIVAGFSYGNYYLISSFMNGFLPLISTISKADAMSLNTLLLLFDFLLLPLFGLLSLKISKEKLILFAILGVLLCCCPLFLLLKDATLFSAAVVRIVLMVFGVILAAPYHAWVFENSPADHRYLIGAFSTAIGGRLFGAPIVPLGLWLYHKTGLVVAPTFPLIAVGALALLTLLPKFFIKRAGELHIDFEDQHFYNRRI